MSGYSLFTNCSFYEKNNKLDYYRGKDCLKKFFQDIRKQANSIIDFEEKHISIILKNIVLYVKNHSLKITIKNIR